MYIGANFIKWCKQADISNPLFDLEKDSCDLKNLRTQKMCSRVLSYYDMSLIS